MIPIISCFAVIYLFITFFSQGMINTWKKRKKRKMKRGFFNKRKGVLCFDLIF